MRTTVVVITSVAVVAAALTYTGFNADPGLTLEQLVLCSQTLKGTWIEHDPLVDDESKWIGSAAVIEEKHGKLILVSNSHCLGLRSLAHADLCSSPEVKSYSVAVTFASGAQAQVERFAETPRDMDLALLEVSAAGMVRGRDYVVLPRPTKRDLKIGDEVVAVGTPLTPKLAGTHTFGRVSALREAEGYRVIQTDAALNHGNSGGPLMVKDKNGSFHWVGINTACVEVGSGIGLAIDACEVSSTRFQWFTANAEGAAAAICVLHNTPASTR
jgi:S1-C subfamily serine protease